MAREIEGMVDDMIVLRTPPSFRAVAQFYEHWRDVSDQEVLEIVDTWRRGREKGG